MPLTLRKIVMLILSKEKYMNNHGISIILLIILSKIKFKKILSFK